MRLSNLTISFASVLVSSRFSSSNSFVVARVLLSSTVPSRSVVFASSLLLHPPSFTRAMATNSNNSSSENTSTAECNATLYDAQFPGTALQRLASVHSRVAQLVSENALQNKPWEEVRRSLLWAGGLRDLPNAIPGQGYTGHSFNDFNHVDLTTMNDDSSDNLHDGSIQGIAVGNRLGPGIKIASLPELGPGGSWSTCAMGCNTDPPRDVAHVQFRSRIAFKLVWVPNANFDTFVLVDDDGKLLAVGKPDNDGTMPSRREREKNWSIVQGSKYAVVAKEIALNST
ncbi:hypothetical protein HJC23_005628 [Cyclotella cryptica]|uniref:Uncharacterized protein n=1 Tax=Cyclotella cryptica TaxID=29204 RepID=A0ABD3Q0G1_9STRA